MAGLFAAFKPRRAIPGPTKPIVCKKQYQRVKVWILVPAAHIYTSDDNFDSEELTLVK
jgi:hypothetical protein